MKHTIKLDGSKSLVIERTTNGNVLARIKLGVIDVGSMVLDQGQCGVLIQALEVTAESSRALHASAPGSAL